MSQLLRDRLAVAAALVVLLILLASFPGAWLAANAVGHGPNDLFFDGIDEQLVPKGPLTRVADPATGEREILILGADGPLGRDEFLRVLYGGRTSLGVAFLAVSLGAAVAAPLGIVARRVRASVLDVLLWLPAAAWAAAFLVPVLSFRLLELSRLRIVVLLALVATSVLAWVVRTARDPLRQGVAAALFLFAGFVFAEASVYALSPPTPSWGNLLAQAADFYDVRPDLIAWPATAVMITTSAVLLLAIRVSVAGGTARKIERRDRVLATRGTI